MLQAQKDYCDSRDAMLRLWVHECSRAFSDRFTNTPDKEFFTTLLDEKLVKDFQGVEIKKLYKDGQVRLSLTLTPAPSPSPNTNTNTNTNPSPNPNPDPNSTPHQESFFGDFMREVPEGKT